MTVVIDGKAFARRLREKVGSEVAEISRRAGVVPGLATILVGHNPASEVYIRNKIQQTGEAGMASFHHKLDASVSEDELLSLISELNSDVRIHGILVQLPLPRQINPERVLDAIDPAKDVDGFHISNVGRLSTGQKAMVPCTPSGCIMMLREQLGPLRRKDALVIGRSNIVGKPMAQMLLAEDCTVTIAHRLTHDLAARCRQADIIVVAVGRPGFLPGDWIKPGATVIDVGINSIQHDGKTRLVGDVDFQSAIGIAGAITPVPGGVGPMTIACLLLNTLTAFCRINGFADPDVVDRRSYGPKGQSAVA